MKTVQFNSEQYTMNRHMDPHKLSRREFMKLGLVTSAGLGLWLAGCSPGAKENEEPLAVVDKWIQALNAEDAPGFAALHSESVFATTHTHRDPFSGPEQVWDSYSKSTGSQLEKIIAFSQGQSVCLLVNATKFNRSLCYVFNFAGGLIDRVYEYSSGRYGLATSPQFSGIEITGDDTGLQDRMDVVDYVFVESLESLKENPDLTFPGVRESVILYVPTAADPLSGYENFVKDGKDYVTFFPSVSHEKIQTFGQSNLVCCHVAASNTPKGSLCFVAVFHDGEMAEVYEFWSEARVGSLS